MWMLVVNSVTHKQFTVAWVWLLWAGIGWQGWSPFQAISSLKSHRTVKCLAWYPKQQAWRSRYFSSKLSEFAMLGYEFFPGIRVHTEYSAFHILPSTCVYAVQSCHVGCMLSLHAEDFWDLTLAYEEMSLTFNSTPGFPPLDAVVPPPVWQKHADIATYLQGGRVAQNENHCFARKGLREHHFVPLQAL